MEHRVRIIEPDVLMEHLPDLLQETEAVPLIITGSSMMPFLVHGRDTVYLSKITGPLKKGDMILYRRGPGVYILHRICRVKDGAYDLVGDGQYAVESDISHGQVIAVVKAVQRNGKTIQPGDLCWEFFAHVWPALRPFRSRAYRAYCYISAWRKQK